MIKRWIAKLKTAKQGPVNALPLLAPITAATQPRLYNTKFTLTFICAKFIFIFSILSFPLCAFAEDVSMTGTIGQLKECKSSFCFSKTALVGKDEIPLRNLARKDYLFFKLYFAALYLEDKIDGIEQLLGEVPKKLVFRYLRNIDGADVIKAADEVLKQNPEISLAPLQSRLDEINKAYANGIKEGDVFELDYIPSVGTMLTINGKVFSTVPGSDFAKAYFGIWLSKYPLSEDFRDALIVKELVR